MKDGIEHVVQRTRQYWFSDGLVELSVGITFSLLGLYFYIQSVLPTGSLVLFATQAGFILLLFGVIFLGRYIVHKFKSQLTYPRTGYVSFKRASRNQRVLSASAAILIAAVNMLLFLTTPLSLNWVPAITGLFVGLIWLISALRVGLLRFYLQSILALLLGFGLSLAEMEIYQSLAVFYVAMGLVLIISGGLTLRKYLRQDPILENDFPA